MLLTILCKINYIREKQSYVLLSPKMCDGFQPVLFKFDTGASFTSITLGSLIDADKITKREQEILKKQLLNLDYPHRPLISASEKVLEVYRKNKVFAIRFFITDV